MNRKKVTFALYFANRGFFPGEAIEGAIEEIKNAVTDVGFGYICMDTSQTRYGAIETIHEGKKYAEFLEENKGDFDGVILCLPNFGDENGALAAFKNINTPILVHAYPDEIGQMDFAHRRDAMCGKFAICNALRQANIPYTLTNKFVSHPSSNDFKEDLLRFGGICRIVKGMKNINIGAIGARTTAFKTVRLDEIALQNHGINLDTFDLSDVFKRMETVDENKLETLKDKLLSTTTFKGYPDEKLTKMAKLQAVLEDIIKEYDLNGLAIRCWSEFQTVLGIAPCTNVGILNEMGISTACEVDVTNSIMMIALSLAADAPTMLLDFNNNYGTEADKCVMFHCGCIPISMMNGKGEVIEHLMFKKSYGEGSGVGVNKGEIRSGNITFGSLKTENGKLYSFVSEAKFTDDIIENEFFGCGKVVEKKDINALANYMAENGYKHHLAITYGLYADMIKEAFEKYLHYEIDVK